MCTFLYDSWFYSKSMALLQTHGVSRPGVADSQSLWIWTPGSRATRGKSVGTTLGSREQSRPEQLISFFYIRFLWFIILESPEWTVLKYWKRIFLPSWKWKMGSWKMTLVSNGGPLFTSTFFFEKKRVYTSKIIWLYVYMFQVPGPFPHPPCHYKRYTTSFPWFSPPRGGWPWSRVPWMDQIQGWLKKHKKKDGTPQMSVLIFFHVSFFLEWDYYGHTEAVNDCSVRMKSVKLCPQVWSRTPIFVGWCYIQRYRAQIWSSSKFSNQSLPISIPPFFLEILKRLFFSGGESSWYLPSTSGQLDESKKCHRIGSVISGI